MAGTHRVLIGNLVLLVSAYSMCKKAVLKAVRSEEGLDRALDSEAFQDVVEFLSSTQLTGEHEASPVRATETRPRLSRRNAEGTVIRYQAG